MFSHTLALLSHCYSHRKVMAQILKLQCMYSTNYSRRKTLVLNTSLYAYKNPSFAPVKQATASLPCNIIKLRFRELMAHSFPCCLSAPQAPILPGRSCCPVSCLSHTCIKQCMARDAAEVTRTKGKLISLSQSCFHTWELQSNLIHKLQFNRSTLL